MHTKEAAHAGETALRMNLVGTWRETTVFTDAERAALELTEQGTRLADTSGITDGRCRIAPTVQARRPMPYNTTRRDRQQHWNGELHLQRRKRLLPRSRGRNGEMTRAFEFNSTPGVTITP